MIVMIDCGEDKPDTIPAYAGLLDFDNYRSEQATWLKELVKTKEFKKAKYRIVYLPLPHHSTLLPTALSTMVAMTWHASYCLS